MKKYIFMYAILLFLFSCSNDEFREIDQSENHAATDLRIQYKRGSEVSASALNFIKERTNNTFTVSSKKGEVKLNSSLLLKNNELGTVDTSKEIVVVNETNTKHTFKVITPSEPLNTITNLIVVEKENDSYEYFLKYTFAGELPINEETGTIDFSKFNGTIETFNASGDLIGSMTIENGTITNDQGQLSPCPDDNQDPNDDDTNTGSSTGGSDSSTGIPNDDTNEDPVSTGNGDPNSSAQFTDPNGGCGLTWSYEQCGCGGDPNGHPPSGPDCCQGSPLVIRDCNGTILAQRNSDTSTTMFKGSVFDPCDDGDVGVILDDDVLCNMDDENFNAYYSSKSPFNVDMSQVRKYCDSINFPDPANEKFMCLYNKLVNQPLYKNMIENTFGGNQHNIHLNFMVVDSLPGGTVSGRTDKMPGTVATINPQTGEVKLHLRVRISKEFMDNYSAIAMAKTILHETIHAYLMVKHVNCNIGTPIDEVIEDINNKSFEELMEYYFNNACDGQEQHEFMYDKMLPVFRNILSGIRDDLIPEHHREGAELDTGFINESDPDGETVAFNWNEFYKYLSLQGLQNTNFFANEILNNEAKYSNYLRYSDYYGRLLFEKDCTN